MIMADVLTWFLLILGAYLVFIGYWLASIALFPRLVEEAQAQYRRRPVLATVLGIACLVPLIVVAAAAAKIPHPLVKGLVSGAALIPTLLALVGSAGLALRIGRGLDPVEKGPASRAVLRGGAIQGLCFLLPFLGWFVVLPWVLVSGFGVAVLGALSVRRQNSAAPPAPLAPSAAE